MNQSESTTSSRSFKPLINKDEVIGVFISKKKVFNDDIKTIHGIKIPSSKCFVCYWIRYRNFQLEYHWPKVGPNGGSFTAAFAGAQTRTTVVLIDPFVEALIFLRYVPKLTFSSNKLIKNWKINAHGIRIF